MKVGVYVDGYNLYYAARRSCGRGTPGWRWLNIRSLAESLIAEQPAWQGSTIEKVVYCTARISARTNPSGHADQDAYINALTRSKSVTAVEFGNYVARVKQAPLAVKDANDRPVVYTSQWPIMVQSSLGAAVRNAVFMVSYLHNEEKGSDVNVATHLLVDVLEKNVDAAIVISNDSDLKLPLKQAWARVPTAVVNPGNGFTALNGSPAAGPGGHWWRSLTAQDFKRNQLPDPAGGVRRPVGW
ncbi:NYN domain-containing protein [Kribbella sp. NPDC004536]|uniref:NYN domain-containing protein n=1 Tax=Kribbella sp. NPDC004536 TaxID=3364106 RepID=UPI0036B43A2D